MLQQLPFVMYSSPSGSSVVSFCICCPISWAYCWNGIEVCPLWFKLKWNILLCSIFCKLFLNFCNWSAASKEVSSSDDTTGLNRVALKQKLNFHCGKTHDFTFVFFFFFVGLLLLWVTHFNLISSFMSSQKHWASYWTELALCKSCNVWDNGKNDHFILLKKMYTLFVSPSE